MIGARTASVAGVASSRSDDFRGRVHDGAVVGLLGVVHDPRVLAELLAHLHDDLRRGPPDGADGERGEQERDRAADAAARRARREVDPDAMCRCGGAPGTTPNSDVAAEHRGGDGDALGDGLGRVPDRRRGSPGSRRRGRRRRRTSRRSPARCPTPGRTCPSRRSTPTTDSIPMPASDDEEELLDQVVAQVEAADDGARRWPGSTTRSTRGPPRSRPGSLVAGPVSDASTMSFTGRRRVDGVVLGQELDHGRQRQPDHHGEERAEALHVRDGQEQHGRGGQHGRQEEPAVDGAHARARPRTAGRPPGCRRPRPPRRSPMTIRGNSTPRRRMPPYVAAPRMIEAASVTW